MRLILTIITYFLIIQFGFTQSLRTDLNQAYKKQSDSLLGNFIDQWESKSVKIDNYEFDLLKPLEKDVYLIFEDFYNPFNLDRIGRAEWGNDFYLKLNNVVVQNSINYWITDLDSLNYDSFDMLSGAYDGVLIESYKINNFRPRLDFEDKNIMYLTSEYNKGIRKYLGKKYRKLGMGGIINPARAKGKSEKKLNFINKKLLIVHGHWGGYWHILTHPSVNLVEFNKDQTIAKVHYRLLYQGGEALYFKINDKWILQNAGLIWIE